MATVRAGERASSLVRALRDQVRVRTRLRRAREAWRGRFPRRLPRWSPRLPAPEPALAAPTRVSRRDLTKLTVETSGALRRYAADRAAPPARALQVVVESWRTPYRGWSGRLGPLPGVVRHEVRLPERGRGRATVTVTLAQPLPLSRIITAVRHALEPVGRPPGAAGPADGDAAAGDAAAGDAADGDAALAARQPAGAGTAVVVDASAANPRGRERYGARLPAGRLVLTAEAGAVHWQIARRADGVTVVAGRAGDPLDDRQSAVLVELGAVSFARSPDAPPAAQARVLAQLAMTGVVLHAPAMPAELTASSLLAPELTALLRDPLPDRGDDPLAWELRSVRQRRAAMRRHAAGLVSPGAAIRPPAVSALLVTKRPRLVAPAVAALAAQTYPELEIVVGLHGGEELPAGSLPDGSLPGASPPEVGERRPVQVVPIPARRNLGEALTEATRAARGSLVIKVDDDDRYGPEHVWDLVLARHYSGATVAGKGAEFVYVEPREVTVRRRMAAEIFTDTVAGGTIALARADLEALGGWPPVSRWVDRALLDRVLAAGGLVYRTHPFGFIYTRHGDGHTWEAELDSFLRDPVRSWPGLPSHPEFGTS